MDEGSRDIDDLESVLADLKPGGGREALKGGDHNGREGRSGPTASELGSDGAPPT